MLNEKDILNLLQAYVRAPENRGWLKKEYDVEFGVDTRVLVDIRRELEAAIRSVLPTFKMSGIRFVRDSSVSGSEKYNVIIDASALRRESLYYTTKDGARVQGEGINDILALFTHGYTLKHRAPYGIWDRSSGDSVMVRAKSHRDSNPFLQDLCNRLNAKYHDVCEVTLSDDYKL